MENVSGRGGISFNVNAQPFIRPAANLIPERGWPVIGPTLARKMELGMGPSMVPEMVLEAIIGPKVGPSAGPNY